MADALAHKDAVIAAEGTDLAGGMGREAAMGKVLNLAFQAGSSGGASDMALENWAMPDRSSLPCRCSLLPASSDNSCIATCLSSRADSNKLRSRLMSGQIWIEHHKSPSIWGACGLQQG